jgi:hypothetical protein
MERMFWYSDRVTPRSCAWKEETMFLGWYDPDKKKPARLKVEAAVERYVEKFGGEPVACLTSVDDAAELSADARIPDLIVKGVTFLPRFTFYVGVEDEPAELIAA